MVKNIHVHPHNVTHFQLKAFASWVQFVPLDVVFVRHFVWQLNVGIAVTESCHIRDLYICKLQKTSSVLVFHLHDVEDALHTLYMSTQQRLDRQPKDDVQRLDDPQTIQTQFSPCPCSAWRVQKWSGEAVWGTSLWTTWLVWPSEPAPWQPEPDSTSRYWRAHPHTPESAAQPESTGKRREERLRKRFIWKLRLLLKKNFIKISKKLLCSHLIKSFHLYIKSVKM